MSLMFEATATDFPFMAEVPKREKSRLVKAWEMFQEISRISKTEGVLIPQVFAARVLDLSTARVGQLCNEGKLRVVVVGNNRFVTENSVLEWAKTEHKAGRPLKNIDPVLEGKETEWQAAIRMGKDLRRDGFKERTENS